MEDIDKGYSSDNIEVKLQDLDMFDLTDEEKIKKLKHRIFVLKMMVDSEKLKLTPVILVNKSSLLLDVVELLEMLLSSLKILRRHLSRVDSTLQMSSTAPPLSLLLKSVAYRSTRQKSTDSILAMR